MEENDKGEQVDGNKAYEFPAFKEWGEELCGKASDLFDGGASLKEAISSGLPFNTDYHDFSERVAEDVKVSMRIIRKSDLRYELTVCGTALDLEDAIDYAYYAIDGNDDDKIPEGVKKRAMWQLWDKYDPDSYRTVSLAKGTRLDTIMKKAGELLDKILYNKRDGLHYYHVFVTRIVAEELLGDDREADLVMEDLFGYSYWTM